MIAASACHLTQDLWGLSLPQLVSPLLQPPLTLGALLLPLLLLDARYLRPEVHCHWQQKTNHCPNMETLVHIITI